ncbi:MAG: PAS domain-containing sensor histidine kinase [Rhodospirillales bacterium]|nr:PAS domain-containing sensor histidine kinase [Rhodospirillales bacterium]
MQNRTIILFSISVLVMIFCFSVFWEFALEFQALSFFGIHSEPETYSEHLKYVITVTAFALVALIASTLVLLRLNTRRNQVEEAFRQSEEKFQRVMAASPAGIFIKDLDGRFQYSNSAHRAAFGNGEEIVGQTTYDLFSPEQAGIFEEQDREVVISGKVKEYEFERTNKTVGRLFFKLVKFPIFDRHGKVGGIGGISSNITERKQAEQIVIQAMDASVQSNQAKSMFLAHMSHELRTPLNAVIGFSQMMEDHTFGPLGDPKYDEYTAIIHSSGKHLLSLIDDVLDLSKIEAGTVETNLVPIDVGELIASSIDIVRGQVMANDMNLYTEIANNLPHLLADRRMAKQMLLNLLSNAVKFTPEDGEIKVIADLASDGGIQISIVDNGIGIAKEDIPIVLTPYAQIVTDTKVQGRGTGLGIPLVVELLKLHKGRLGIDSRVDYGTTVTLNFPVEATQYNAQF